MELSVEQYQELYRILRQYPLEVSHLELLQYHGRAVARVETPDAPYVLRVSYPLTRVERVREELDWLQALRHDTDLIVPSPVANKQGEFITSWGVDEGEPLQYCLLFNWVEGDSVRDSLSTETATAVGVVLARLHRHAQAYTAARATAFVGPRYDFNWLLGPASWWADGHAISDLGSDTYRRLQPAIALAGEAMSRLGEGSQHFGIIHSDLHFDNILLQNDRCALIDFDDCALGYYLYDLAITEQAFRYHYDHTPILAAFHEGYCRERGIPLASLRDIDAFMIAVDVGFLAWILRTDEVEARELLLPQVPEHIEHILACAERAKQSS
ncbi:homoserine kinase [Dictyobacter sp. S3.2.2.5]|uniref:Homoserine kinase n=1 Tax=Dictyobacter halimunensis TaxID=3026934 RepID=A0ABQ6G1F0_9CHLR|nr:homoserine kinase [Dictyobacter sp. S3.2.2.5]